MTADVPGDTPGAQPAASASSVKTTSQSSLDQDTSASEPRPPAIAVTARQEFGVPPTLVTLAGIVGRLLIVGFALVVFLWLIFQVGAVAIAIFLGALLTALALPLAHFLQRFRVPKVLAVILSLFTIAAVGIFILVQVVSSIIAESGQLSGAVTDGMSEIQDWLKNGPIQLSDEQLTSVNQQVEQWAENLGGEILSGVASEAGTLGTLITAGAVFFFATFFFMVSGASIWGWVVGWVPARARDAFNTSGRIAWGSLAGYTRGMVIVALADALLVLIGLLILQVPLAPALAAVVFMGAFIPVIGAPVATFFAAIVALATKGLTTAILVVLLTIVVGSFDGDVLQPLVMGKAVSLHPLAIVTIIATGAIAFGIIGALIAVPVASSLYGVMKYLSGRDPDNPLPSQQSNTAAANAPPSEPVHSTTSPAG
ncbi:MAG: AI-2E family transporter [Actinomycetia bacterium]|nr:AI-2E family transporter [Actinomycetes bacterium]